MSAPLADMGLGLEVLVFNLTTQERADHTLQATALVHEAYVRLVGDQQVIWNSRAHSFGAAARAMRRILVEQARRKARPKRGGDRERVSLEHVEVAVEPLSGDWQPAAVSW